MTLLLYFAGFVVTTLICAIQAVNLDDELVKNLDGSYSVDKAGALSLLLGTIWPAVFIVWISVNLFAIIGKLGVWLARVDNE